MGWNRPLDATSPTLAEFLGARGYATAGFVANTTYCSYETGLARGFAHYEDYDVTLHAVLLCSALVQRTLNFVDKHPGLRLYASRSPPTTWATARPRNGSTAIFWPGWTGLGRTGPSSPS